MNQLVECVPNFSEGRRSETIKRLVEAIESAAGTVVLNTHMDADHNRSVVTFAAAPEQIVEAAVRACACAAELIDLRAHRGVHPRVGAMDVLPFVPVRNVSLAECVRLAHRAGERIASELGIPVYFYERAAMRPERVNLEDVRRSGFEKLREEIGTVRERAPDVGEPRVHETAGACVVGARPFLIAYNINLLTNDVTIARRIASAVRGKNGGLPFLKALGLKLESRGIVQVSMNLVNPEVTGLHQAFAAVAREAEREGVRIAGSEVVGLLPQYALDEAARSCLQLENYAPAIVLENQVEAMLARHGEEGKNSEAFNREAIEKDSSSD
jgi:glutamate formiminotransferase